jgi:bis(5'-adenosyl)-triphosphatase
MGSVFYRQGNTLAIYNIAPVLPGHSLIIPEKHITSLLDLSQAEMVEFFNTARVALQILMNAFHTDAFDWSVQEKPEAGQTVEHLHLHIVPRLKGDLRQPGDWYPLIQHNDTGIIDSLNRQRISREDLHQIVRELRMKAGELFPESF